MFKKIIVIFLSIFVLSIQLSFAEISNDELLEEIRALKQQIERQEQRINELEEELKKQKTKPATTIQLKDMTIEDFDRHLDTHILHREEGYQLLGGLRMGAGATFVIQGTHNANGDSLAEDREDVIDASYSIDLEFEKEFEGYDKVFLHLETGDGAGVEDELKVFSNVNRDTDDSDNSLSLTEMWYRHHLDPIPLTLTVGKIDGTILVDTNEYANDETNQFLSRIFRNSPVIEFPDNTGGLFLSLEPVELIKFDLLMMDGDNDWEDIADDGFYAAQLTLNPHFLARRGNYRILCWSSDRAHTKWRDPTRTKEETFGFGISFDQELTDELGSFLRYGWQDEDVYLNGKTYSLERAWSAGVQLKGSLWNREEDTLGIAVGQVIPSDKYKNADSSRSAKDEGHLEAYYKYKANGHLTFTPDVQFIWNPYGNDASKGDETVTVVGMRGQVDF